MQYIERNEQNRVMFIHRMPFHEEYGLGRTREELVQRGILVDGVPEPEERDGMIPVPYYNPGTKEVYYEYENIPRTPEEEQAEEIETLKQQTAMQQMLLDDLLLNVIPMMMGGEM